MNTSNRTYLIVAILVVGLISFLLTSCDRGDCPDSRELDALIGPMIQVDGGTFQMGSADTVPNRKDDETLHTVSVSGFQMQSTEVTQGLWEKVMGDNPSADKTWKDLPVTRVSWHDAQKFIAKLNQCTGRNYRLPTEAEWEFAVKGGNKSKGYLYSGSNNIEDVAWHDGNSGDRLHVVREKQPNELGIYDMSGNVWEWCSDWYAPYRSDSGCSQIPQALDHAKYRVLRGGGWSYGATDCRTANRGRINPVYRDGSSGFRLVLSPS